MDKVRLENLERLKKISKETNFIFSNFEDINKENIIAILSSDETKRRAVFMALINIQENLEKAIKSNDTEIAALFSQEDLERIKQTRNVAAHDSGAMKFYKVANLIRFDLIRIRDNSLRFIESQSLKEKVENIEVKVIENKKDFLTKIAIGLGVAVIFALGILFFVLANKLGIFGASVDNLIYPILFIVSGLIGCCILYLFKDEISKSFSKLPKFIKNNFKISFSEDFDYILNNAVMIGNKTVTRIGKLTMVGDEVVTRIGKLTMVGDKVVTRIGKLTMVGDEVVTRIGKLTMVGDEVVIFKKKNDK